MTATAGEHLFSTKGRPTLIAPPLHPARQCPNCNAESTAIVADRCLTCRTPAAQRQEAATWDVIRQAWTVDFQQRHHRPDVPPVPHVVPAPRNCSTCGQAKHGLADGRCLTCRLASKDVT